MIGSGFFCACYTESVRCISCQAEIVPDQDFCFECGEPVVEAKPAPRPAAVPARPSVPAGLGGAAREVVRARVTPDPRHGVVDPRSAAPVDPRSAAAVDAWAVAATALPSAPSVAASDLEVVSPARAFEAVPAAVTSPPQVPNWKRWARQEAEAMVRCPGCGVPSNKERCGGCGIKLRRDD